MWRRLIAFAGDTIQKPNPNPFGRQISTCPLPTNSQQRINLLRNLKRRKKKKAKKESARTRRVQLEPSRLNPHLESIVSREASFRFLTRTKDFLSLQPEHVLSLPLAGKLYRELGFPRGRKVSRFAIRHPLLLSIYRHSDNSSWLGLTDLMDDLLREEDAIMSAMEPQRALSVAKLLMMSRDKRIPLSKIHHCRQIFGISHKFRDRITNYPEYFRLSVNPDDGQPILELADWDPKLAVSKLEKDFVLEEERVRRTFRFSVPHGKSLGMVEEDRKQLDLVSTLPLVSPYSDGWKLKPWSVEAEKYRVGVVHEFLSLTLEKRASIHHIVEFKDEFCLTKHMYAMLKRQSRAFYLAGTEMNWTVFLREAYGDLGVLIDKDPQVIFNEKLQRYACMSEAEYRNERDLESADGSARRSVLMAGLPPSRKQVMFNGKGD